MIITPFPDGRLANRLMLAANWIAHAEETHDRYLHLGFSRFSRFFEGTRSMPFLFFKATHYAPRKYNRFFGYLDIRRHQFNSDYNNIESTPFIEIQNRTKYLFTVGWEFRTTEKIMQKHRDSVVRYFTLTDRYRGNVARHIESARKSSDHLIGVHIRQTDYSTFKGGKWLYSNAVYRQKMEEARSQLSGRSRFLICSDTEIDCTSFSGLDVITGTGHFVEDCYSLAQCDFILGPPSTYSLWASFFGKVPIVRIFDADQSVILAQATYRTRP